MQTIKAGDIRVNILGIFWGAASINGSPVESLRVSFPSDITEAQLAALLSNPWEIYHEDGTIIGIQAGVNQVAEYSMLFHKVPDTAKMQAQLNDMATQLAEAKKAADVLQKANDDANGIVEHAAGHVAMYQEALYRMGVDPSPEAVAAMLSEGTVSAGMPAEATAPADLPATGGI